MSKLKVFGVAQSRAARTLWMCRELDLDFEHISTHFANETIHDAKYTAINPNQKIPSIQDGELVLWESMAINIYLAKKHKSELMPNNLADESRVLQWSFWVMTEVEKPLLNVMFQHMDFDPETPEGKYFNNYVKKDSEIEASNLAMLQKPLDVLETQLSDSDYLLGENFTVADLNVAAVMFWSRQANIDLTTRPHLDNWLNRCAARPAAQAQPL